MREELLMHGEDFVLLISGTADNDRLVRRYVGRDHPIYYKSRYTPPYERFDELKKLLLRVKAMDDVNEDNVIAVDLSEWIGHEDEEYLTVMVKYFHDQRDHWRYVFTVGDCDRTEVAKLYITLKTYLRGSIVIDETFMSAAKLEEYILDVYRVQRETARELSGIFFDRRFRAAKSYEILESIMNELKAVSGGRKITAGALKKYRESEDSLIFLLMGGRPASREERCDNV